MRRFFGTGTAVWSLAAVVIALAASGEASAKVGVGVRAPNFVLQDAHGETHALADFRDKKGVVLVFLGTECPVANLYVPDLVALQEKYAEQGVQFIALNPNPGDTPEKIAAHAADTNGAVLAFEFVFALAIAVGVADQILLGHRPIAFVVSRPAMRDRQARADWRPFACAAPLPLLLSANSASPPVTSSSAAISAISRCSARGSAA